MNTQKIQPGRSAANAASFIQNPKPLLVNQESIKMATKIEQFSYADRVAALTNQYLELGLPLNSALRAAEADLWPVVKPRSTHQIAGSRRVQYVRRFRSKGLK
jgi:hypothetical protein